MLTKEEHEGFHKKLNEILASMQKIIQEVFGSSQQRKEADEFLQEFRDLQKEHENFYKQDLSSIDYQKKSIELAAGFQEVGNEAKLKLEKTPELGWYFFNLSKKIANFIINIFTLTGYSTQGFFKTKEDANDKLDCMKGFTKGYAAHYKQGQ